MVTPLTTLTCKNQSWTWGSEQQVAFTTLLSRFQTAPILCLPDVCCPFIVMTDASLLASRGVLMQRDDNRDLHPCVHLSQMFSSAEQNYDIYNWELLAVIHALDHWHHYLQGISHPITLLTNHKNLTYFQQPQKLSRCQAQWMMFLQDFDLHFIHIPGVMVQRDPYPFPWSHDTKHMTSIQPGTQSPSNLCHKSKLVTPRTMIT